MKTLVLFLMLLSVPSVLLADDPIAVTSGGCDVEPFDTTAWDAFRTDLMAAFPLNVLVAVGGVLEQLSQISASSPSSLTIPLAMAEFKPFGFLETDGGSVFTDTIMPIIRWFMLGSVLVSIASFVLDKIL